MIARYRPLLINLFTEAQRIHIDPFRFTTEYLNLQEILIQKITYVEQQIRRLKANIKALHKLLGSKGLGLDKDASKKAKNGIARYHVQLEEYQELLAIMRWIGDALAFSFLDRYDIKPLGFHKENAGFLSGKRGSRRERKIFRAVFNWGRIAILNDLTNCLRYGDITVFDKNGRYYIFEVKSSKNRSKRVARQVNEAERILEYLRTDHIDRLYGVEGDIQRVAVHAKPEYHISQINDLIVDAMAKGNCYKEVEDGLYYVATIKPDPETPKQISQRCTGKVIFVLVNPKMYRGMAYYPLSLSILNPEALYLLCAGKLFIVIAIDVGVVEEKLEANGIRLEAISENEDYALSVRRIQPANGQPSEMKIGGHLFNRVFTEFMSLDWIVQWIVTSMKTDTTIKLEAG
jgi:hypothetical protein